MSKILDMSLDDLIRKNREQIARNTNVRGRDFGLVMGAGPDRRVTHRVPNRPQPYSVPPGKGMQAQEAIALGNEGSNRESGGGEGTKLYLSNLDYGVSNEDIKLLFSEVGELLSHSIHYDMSGRSKGTAEVVFARQIDALTAIKRYNSVQLDGKPLKIELVGVNLVAAVPVPLTATANVEKPKPNGAFRSVQERIGARVLCHDGGGDQAFAKGQGQRRRHGEKLTAEELDSDLEKYRSTAMKTK